MEDEGEDDGEAEADGDGEADGEDEKAVVRAGGDDAIHRCRGRRESAGDPPRLSSWEFIAWLCIGYLAYFLLEVDDLSLGSCSRY